MRCAVGERHYQRFLRASAFVVGLTPDHKITQKWDAYLRAVDRLNRHEKKCKVCRGSV